MAFPPEPATSDMNWKNLKQHVYHEDGSLRDIYIRNVTPAHWRLWVEYVNGNYLVDFKIGGNVKGDKIDFDAVKTYWQDPYQACPSASIYVGEIIVNTFFFDGNEIENDITPKEIKSVANHEQLLHYLMNVSLLLGKPVILTEENYQNPKELLITVDGQNIILHK